MLEITTIAGWAFNQQWSGQERDIPQIASAMVFLSRGNERIGLSDAIAL